MKDVLTQAASGHPPARGPLLVGRARALVAASQWLATATTRATGGR